MRKNWIVLTAAFVFFLFAIEGAVASQDAAAIAKEAQNAMNLDGELEPWQQVRVDMLNNYEEFQKKYAPAVKTLSNGVRIQRTPSDPDRVNIKFYDADHRGCAACHEDLGELLMNMDDLSGSGAFWYGHTDLRNELGIENTYLQCLSCHKNSKGGGLTYRLEMSTMMHRIHNDNTAFGKVGGTCWSCHFVDELTGSFDLWDMVKYDVMFGINKVPNVEGEFSYDQNKLSGDIFTLTNGYDWAMKSLAGMQPDPEHDGVYEQYVIKVGGYVQNPCEWTLRELIDEAPHVTDIGTFACEINGYGGSLIESFEFTGIPVTWLIEQAGPDEGTNAFKNEYWGGPWTFEFLEDFPCYLVYEINGKPLSYADGYPVMLFCMDGFAGADIKNIHEINVIKTENTRYLYKKYHGGGGAYLTDPTETPNHPNVGICNFTDGMIIPNGEPYTFEGYAHAFQYGIDAIEFSLDNGETWTRFDTTAAKRGKWLYWNFTWTPEKPGAYVLSVRAFAEDGKTFKYANKKMFNVE